ncbi:MAG: hypothetical protein RL538_142 [Candidatus Parcubacteria bacterium]|jgi:hypothetical protein
MQKIEFSKNLIKGRVGEMTFEQMLRDEGESASGDTFNNAFWGSTL